MNTWPKLRLATATLATLVGALCLAAVGYWFVGSHGTDDLGQKQQPGRGGSVVSPQFSSVCCLSDSRANGSEVHLQKAVVASQPSSIRRRWVAGTHRVLARSSCPETTDDFLGPASPMMPSWNQVVGFLTDWEGAAEAGCLGLCPWQSPLLQPTRAKRDNDHDIRGRVAPFTGAVVANRLTPVVRSIVDQIGKAANVAKTAIGAEKRTRASPIKTSPRRLCGTPLAAVRRPALARMIATTAMLSSICTSAR